MGAVEIIVLQEPVKVSLELRDGVIAFSSQGNLQELFENRPVESFGEAVGPRVFDLGVAVFNPALLQEELEVVIASQDGFLYVFNHDGTFSQWWPQYMGSALGPDPYANICSPGGCRPEMRVVTLAPRRLYTARVASCG